MYARDIAYPVVQNIRARRRLNNRRPRSLRPRRRYIGRNYTGKGARPRHDSSLLARPLIATTGAAIYSAVSNVSRESRDQFRDDCFASHCEIGREERPMLMIFRLRS